MARIGHVTRLPANSMNTPSSMLPLLPKISSISKNSGKSILASSTFEQGTIHPRFGGRTRTKLGVQPTRDYSNGRHAIRIMQTRGTLIGCERSLRPTLCPVPGLFRTTWTTFIIMTPGPKKLHNRTPHRFLTFWKNTRCTPTGNVRVLPPKSTIWDKRQERGTNDRPATLMASEGCPNIKNGHGSDAD